MKNLSHLLTGLLASLFLLVGCERIAEWLMDSDGGDSCPSWIERAASPSVFPSQWA